MENCANHVREGYMDPVRREILIYMGEASEQLAILARTNHFEKISRMFSAITARARKMVRASENDNGGNGREDARGGKSH